MNEAPLETFQEAIQATHGANSRLLCQEQVVETFEGETVWEGGVLVFELFDHPTATTCYAWELDGEVTAVLHQGPVDGPQAAVRAAIMADSPPGGQT